MITVPPPSQPPILQAVEKIISLAPELQSKADPGKASEIAIKDRRADTSPVNGRKGGRPHDRPEILAESFIRAKFKTDSICTLRFYKGKWYEWRGGIYRERPEDHIRAEISGFLQEIGIGEIVRLSKSKIEDVLAMLKAPQTCVLDPDDYAMPCFLSNAESAVGWMPMKNCVVNIEKAAEAIHRGAEIPPAAIRPASPDLFTTIGLNYDFIPAAQCPAFLRYLEEVQPNEENRKVLQMLAGLSLVPDTRYNVAFFLYGEGGTGKSVFEGVLKGLIGDGNYCCVPLAALADRFGKAPLTTTLMNIVGDMPMMPESGRTADIEGIFKDVTGGGVISVEEKGKDAWKARVTARMLFATNVLPHISDKSQGVWDRLRIIPFNQRVRGTAREDVGLPEKLSQELPGILVWALHGLAALRQEQGFPECAEGKALKDGHLIRCDRARAFLLDRTEAAPDGWVARQVLYDAYKNWCYENGYHPVGADNFADAVKRLYPNAIAKRERTPTGRIHIWCGLKMSVV